MKGYPPLFSTTLSSLKLYNEDFRIFVVSWWVLWEIYHIFQVNIGVLSTVFSNVFLSTFPSLFVFFFLPVPQFTIFVLGTARGKEKEQHMCYKMMANGKGSPHHSKLPSDRLTKAHGDAVSCSKERGEGIRQRTDRYTFFLPFFLINSRFHTKFWFLAVNMELYSSVFF